MAVRWQGIRWLPPVSAVWSLWRKVNEGTRHRQTSIPSNTGSQNTHFNTGNPDIHNPNSNNPLHIKTLNIKSRMQRNTVPSEQQRMSHRVGPQAGVRDPEIAMFQSQRNQSENLKKQTGFRQLQAGVKKTDRSSSTECRAGKTLLGIESRQRRNGREEMLEVQTGIVTYRMFQDFI